MNFWSTFAACLSAILTSRFLPSTTWTLPPTAIPVIVTAGLMAGAIFLVHLVLFPVTTAKFFALIYHKVIGKSRDGS